MQPAVLVDGIGRGPVVADVALHDQWALHADLTHLTGAQRLVRVRIHHLNRNVHHFPYKYNIYIYIYVIQTKKLHHVPRVCILGSRMK